MRLAERDRKISQKSLSFPRRYGQGHAAIEARSDTSEQHQRKRFHVGSAGCIVAIVPRSLWVNDVRDLAKVRVIASSRTGARRRQCLRQAGCCPCRNFASPGDASNRRSLAIVALA